MFYVLFLLAFIFEFLSLSQYGNDSKKVLCVLSWSLSRMPVMIKIARKTHKILEMSFI